MQVVLIYFYIILGYYLHHYVTKQHKILKNYIKKQMYVFLVVQVFTVKDLLLLRMVLVDHVKLVNLIYSLGKVDVPLANCVHRDVPPAY